LAGRAPGSRKHFRADTLAVKLMSAVLMVSSVPVLATVAIERQIVAPPKAPNAAPPPASPHVVAVRPVSQAATIASSQIERSSPFVSQPAPMTAYRRSGPVVFAGMSVMEIMMVGMVLAALTIFARRRHRRRVGWGLVPDRSVGRSRP
jgi:hypothetical protein